MNLATQYAAALYRSEAPDKKKLEGLRATLKRRGHEKLAPRILAEYGKLEERAERRERYSKATPESERTRVLLELYQKLIHSSPSSL